MQFMIYLRKIYEEGKKYMVDTNIRVRYAETDAMGVVHHSSYYLYFEEAREDLIKALGIKYKDMEDMGVMMPLVETHCKYIEAAKYGDELIITSSVKEITPVKVRINYIVKRKEDNKLLAKGETLQTFVDKNTFKIINLQRSYPKIWEIFNK